MSISNGHLISLIYEVQHSHVLQVEASGRTSVFPLVVVTEDTEDTEDDDIFDRVFKILFTKHPLYQRLEFTGQHYTIAAEYFMTSFLGPP